MMGSLEGGAWEPRALRRGVPLTELRFERRDVGDDISPECWEMVVVNEGRDRRLSPSQERVSRKWDGATRSRFAR